MMDHLSATTMKKNSRGLLGPRLLVSRDDLTVNQLS